MDDIVQKRSEFSKTLAENGYTDVLVLSRESGVELFQNGCIEVIDELHEEPATQDELEETLQRPVSDNLVTLTKNDIVSQDEENGEVYIKHDHIVIEPLLR